LDNFDFRPQFFAKSGLQTWMRIYKPRPSKSSKSLGQNLYGSC